RALCWLVIGLCSRALMLGTTEQPRPAGAPLEADVRFERALLQAAVVVPGVRVSELYALGDGVDLWNGEAVNATGGWNFANVWIRQATRGRAAIASRKRATTEDTEAGE